MSEPIACSLNAQERSERERWLERLRAEALSVRATPDGIVARFPRDERIDADVRDLVRAESECCPFLRFRVEPSSDYLELDVSGPTDARPVIEGLFAPSVRA